MPRAGECMLNGEVVGIERALTIRDATQTNRRGSVAFACTRCGKAVRPHKAGGAAKAHFEHLSRNPQCDLSDPES